jgi:hypothetical protein
MSDLESKLSDFMDKIGVEDYGEDNWKEVGDILENGWEEDSQAVYEEVKELEDKRVDGYGNVIVQRRIGGDSYRLRVSDYYMSFSKK